MSELIINGRYLTQGITGVQRFAREIVAAADALAARGLLPKARLLYPRGAWGANVGAFDAAVVGRYGGQIWEQWDLPRAAKGAFLLNLGNTAPLLKGARQAVVIHDAGVFDTPQSYSFAFRSWYRLLHRRLARAGARLLTVSAFSRQRLALALGVAADRIGIVPESGEHILRFPPDGGALSRHGLVAGRYALVVGSPVAHKNLAAVAEAAIRLGAAGMVLVLVGAAADAVFRRGGANVPNTVRALGRVCDAALRALYQNAFCLIFPSRYEGFGLPPLEAMACGCPVIAARAGATPEVCGEAALWFDADCPSSLLAALDHLLTSPLQRAALVEAGYRQAAAFTWERAAQRLLAEIEDCLV